MASKGPDCDQYLPLHGMHHACCHFEPECTLPSSRFLLRGVGACLASRSEAHEGPTASRWGSISCKPMGHVLLELYARKARKVRLSRSPTET